MSRRETALASAGSPPSALAVGLARALIRAAQHTPLRGVGGYSAEAFESRGVREQFPQATQEARAFEDFFNLFPGTWGASIKEMVREKDVLDFGSGYGGRSVEYAVRLQARSVCGVEPFERHVERGNAYAASRGASNCRFLLCSQDHVPLPDAAVDVVVSYDVLEHVQDPRVSLGELHRVLRPGGWVALVFPLYDGALSHHLDYVSRLPGMHWMFGPRTLIAAVNGLLSEEGAAARFGTAQQPQPQLSYDRSRLVLPTLNGLTGDSFERMLGGFEVKLLYYRPMLAARKLIGMPTRLLLKSGVRGRLRDAFTSNISCVLVKRDRRPAGE
jgi:SAM-dependent methyltransferase